MKKKIKSLLITMGLLLAFSIQGQNISEGLMMYYNFEGFSGVTVPDAAGKSLDGALNGNPKLKTGFSGLGLECPLSSDYIKLPENITLNLKSFTYATWAYFNSVNGSTRLFDFGNIAGDNNPDDFLCFMPNSGNGMARMRYRTTGGAIGINCDATVATPSKQWVHMAVTFNWDEASATGTATIYINGVAAGTNTYANFNPTMLGGGVQTANNFIAHSRWAQDGNGLNAILDEIRLYDRALSETDMAALYALTSRDLMLANGYSENLISAQENLKLDATLTEVTAPLSLPLTAAGDVTISWKSSNPALIDSLGNINRPAQYDATAILTATLKHENGGKIYFLTKDFTVIVKAFNETGYQLAKWAFSSENITSENGAIKVIDESESKFTATLMNEASIRTIGETEKFNVLDLGNGTGYLDMGTDIGKAIYSLNNYTMCAYFRIDEEYGLLDNNGNFIWTFSNTADAMNDPTGYIIGSLKATSQSVATGRYNIGNQAIGANTNAGKGQWHHIAYVQNGTTGTIYIDGVEVVTGPMSNLPAIALVREGREGTLYNWLGRSNYTSDAYLRRTLIYDFQLWRDAISSDDLNYEINVPETLNKLNNAYNENPNAILPELSTEKEALTLSGLNAVAQNITLPSKGTADASINITWKTNHPEVISTEGTVNRPDYFPQEVVLTAYLMKNGQVLTKEFKANVLEKEGTAFNSNLLVKHNFSTFADTVVTDAAEKHFKGALVNGAKIRTIGEINKFNTLDLTDTTSYFDLGKEMGRVIYNLSDYTMSCYYRVDESNTWLSNAGNFIWTFSNSDKNGTDQTGCLFGGLRSQTMAITPRYWSYGEQVVSAGVVAMTGGWHNMTYTQKDTIGTLYVDGMPVKSDTITWLPSNTLIRNGSLGTNFNWLGRSCYAGDAYLTRALLYDFRIYNKALTEEEIQITELNVGANINALEAAYAENPNTPVNIKNDKNSIYNIISKNGIITIKGLNGSEVIKLTDISGRQIQFNNAESIAVNKGIYIIRINNQTAKIAVR